MNRGNLGRGGYKTFVTFKSCPLMFSRRDLLFHSVLDIPPQIVLLPFSKSVISTVLSPSSALQNFLLFSPDGEYLKGAHHPDFSFRQCYHEGTCRTLHPSETALKSWQDSSLQLPIARKDQLDSHTRFIDTRLTPTVWCIIVCHFRRGAVL